MLPAIHNPVADYTPTVRRLALEQRDRRGRFTRAAVAAKPKAIVPAADVVPEPMSVDIRDQGGRPYHLWFKIIDEIDPQQPGYPSVRFIQAVVCRYYNIRLADLISSRRTLAVVRPRQMAMHLCRELTLFSFPHISRAFSGRDHTTAVHAHKKIAQLALADAAIADDLARLTLAITKKWGMQ